jgi:hypothetical protein
MQHLLTATPADKQYHNYYKLAGKAELKCLCCLRVGVGYNQSVPVACQPVLGLAGGLGLDQVVPSRQPEEAGPCHPGKAG